MPSVAPCIPETSILSIVSWITVTCTSCCLLWVLYFTIHTGALTMVKYFATFMVNSLTSFKNSNSQDETGITIIVQHVLWISGPDSLEKYMLHHCHIHSHEKNEIPNHWLLFLLSCYFWIHVKTNTLSKTQTCPQCWDRYYTLGSYLCLRYQRHGSLIMMCTHTHTLQCVCVYFHFNKHKNNNISVQYSFFGPLFM